MSQKRVIFKVVQSFPMFHSHIHSPTNEAASLDINSVAN